MVSTVSSAGENVGSGFGCVRSTAANPTHNGNGISPTLASDPAGAFTTIDVDATLFDDTLFDDTLFDAMVGTVSEVRFASWNCTAYLNASVWSNPPACPVNRNGIILL